MTKNLKAVLVITYGEGEGANMQTNGVPLSLVVEVLTNICKGMSRTLVAEAQNDVPENQVEDYLDAMIATDRVKLEQIIDKMDMVSHPVSNVHQMADAFDMSPVFIARLKEYYDKGHKEGLAPEEWSQYLQFSRRFTDNIMRKIESLR
jgi:hypothetical protein